MPRPCDTRSDFARVTLLALGLVAVATMSSRAVAVDSMAAASRPVPASSIQPSPLLSIDQNRTTVVDHVVEAWGDALTGSTAALDKEQLRAVLTGLRSDQLLAASLAGSLEGLRNVLANALTTTPPVATGLVQTKALGDAADDLVYTPVVPCRIVDTRNVGGAFAAGGQTRNYHAFLTSGTFAAQGGAASNCAIPANPAAVAINITTIGGGGFLTAWPYNTAQPQSSTLNPAPGQVLANGAIVPTCQPSCAAEFSVFTFGAHLIIDIVGYFKAPGGAIGTVSNIATGTGLSGGPITTTGTLSLASSYQLPQACTNGQVPKSNGAGGWTCAADAVGTGTVTAVTASVPLASSGGNAPNISLTGSIPVANGGTGQTTLAANGLLIGQGTGPVATAVGTSGQVLAGTAGAPAWTGSPSLSGNLALTQSTATAGNILKEGAPFIHNYGYFNTFIGENAGNFAMTSAGNTATGAGALQSNTTGGENTASGFYALISNTGGFANTATGARALVQNTTGSNNTATGLTALNTNQTGSENTATGVGALYSNDFGYHNTATGYQALYNNVGHANTAMGALALSGNMTGVGNAASGTQALSSNTTGDFNTAIGNIALFSNTTGGNNTASGHAALYANTTGDYNVANGHQALLSNTTGGYNTASGIQSLFENSTGTQNTASGAGALYHNTNGNDNAASGAFALFNNTTGYNNTATGVGALQNNTTGHHNIGIGSGGGFSLTTGSYNIHIGNVGLVAENNTIRIGGAQTRTFLAGIWGISTEGGPVVAVGVNANGQLGTNVSSRRFKDDIADMSDASAALMKLRPVTFHYKSDRNPAGRALQYGLIAEDVAEVYPGLVAHSADGEILTVMYQFLPPMLLNEYQKQQRVIEAHSSEVTRLSDAIVKQTTRIAELEHQAAGIALLAQERLAGIAALEHQASEIETLKRQVSQMRLLQQQFGQQTLTAKK